LESGFVLERSEDGSSFTPIAQPVENAESYTDTAPNPLMHYYYRLEALNEIGPSDYSDVVISAPPGNAASAQSPVHKNILVSFYGADPNPFHVSVYGNTRFMNDLTQQLGDTLNAGGLPYRDFEGTAALRHLLSAIDQDGDDVITSAEVDAVTVRVLAWSWGSIEAGNMVRRLAPSNGRMLRWRMEKPIPVSSLVLLDPVHEGLPRRLKFLWGPISNNVVQYTNYYERRPFADSAIDHYIGNVPVGASVFAGFYPGVRLPTQAGSTTEIQVDTSPSFRNWRKSHDFIPPGQQAVLEGRLQGSQINHATLVWYMQDEVKELLPMLP
jgi:hypothetical protein